MTALLELGLAPMPQGATAVNPVAARIQGILSSRESAGSVAVHDVVIPASGTVDVPLAPGAYTIHVTMPSGRIVEQSCELADDQRLPVMIESAPDEERGFSLQESVSKNVAHVLDNAVQARSWEKATEALIAKLPIEMQSEMRDSDLFKSLEGHAEEELAKLRDSVGVPTRGRTLRKLGGAQVTALARRVLKGALNEILPDQIAGATSEAIDSAVSADETKISLRIGALAVEAGQDIWKAMASDTGAAKLASWTLAQAPAVRDAAFLWRLEGNMAEPPERLVGFAKDGEGGFELLSIPAPWRCGVDHRLSPIDILIDASATGTAKSSIAVHDKALEGVLAYLDRGRLAAARPLVEELDRSDAIGAAIFHKMVNPLAACAAAYVGLAIFQPGEGERWDGWLPNIMDRFPDIPDGAIVHARRIVLRPGHPDENRQALAALKQAYRAGLPYFGVGVQLLREMLTLFPEDEEAVEMLNAVSRVASRVDQSQMFTVLRYPKV